MLDGLESEGTARVCVMMTAMNLNHLPPALVRSGRVELWLEMRLPDAEARKKILQTHLRGVPGTLASCDTARVLSVTEGFTGADMKRLVEDAKGLYAFGRATSVELREATEYFIEAAEGVRENKLRYEQAELAAQARPRTIRSGYFYPTPTLDED